MRRSFQCILLIFLFCCFAVNAENTLQQLHVVLRHGDRSPDYSSLYPTDPHLNDTWAPDGYGQLTMYGKMQEYNIGKALRQSYDHFLEKIYSTDVIDPISSDYNRAKMSLELVLAGLYPPVHSQKWNNLLPWQPIPYNYVSLKTDPVMRFAYYYCPKYIDMYHQIENTEYFQRFWRSNLHLIEYINENSGLNATNYFELANLNFALFAEDQTGRQLPEWTKKIYPDFLTTVTNLYYELQLYNDELIKYSGGHLLKKIITDIRAKKDGTLTPKGRQIFVYSGHEFNVAYILGALKVFKPDLPPYGSYVVVEFHKINNVHGVKILHQDYKHETPQYLTVPGCDTFCPLDQFIALTESVIPHESDKC